jgi:ABC-type nitrate/sulfonate/bicarbonate transport system permease component
MPARSIPADQFEGLILPSLDSDADREFLGSIYAERDGNYGLVGGKATRQYLLAWMMLVGSGYGSRPLPRRITAERFACMRDRLGSDALFPDSDEFRFVDADLASLWILQDDGTFLLASAIDESDLEVRNRMAGWQLLAACGEPPRTRVPNPIISSNVLSHPWDILKAFPGLVLDTSKKKPTRFVWKKSLLFAIWVSLRRELIAFCIVLLLALPLGIFMSASNHVRALYTPFLVIGTFIPIAALIPLTIVFLGVNEIQKVTFLALGMFFVLLGLVMKEMDEVDGIYLDTSYTLGFNQLQTLFLVNFPIALPRIWKHFAAIFGLGWGYIIFAEMINVGGSDAVNGIGWLFIIRRRRFQIPDMYAIFFVIIMFAFLFSWLFKGLAWLAFKHERKGR